MELEAGSGKAARRTGRLNNNRGPGRMLTAQMGSARDIQTTGRPVTAIGISGLRRASVRPIAISRLPLNPRHRRAVQALAG
jgi:hypothetical protein